MEVTTLVVFLLLKTCPSSVSSSSSEGTTTTPLPLSRGAGVVAVSTMARGTAAMGGGELGVWVAFGEGRSWIGVVLGKFWEWDVGEVGGIGSEAACVGSSAPLDVWSCLGMPKLCQASCFCQCPFLNLHQGSKQSRG